MLEVLANMAELAKSMDIAHFQREAMYSSRKLSSRLSSKHEALDSVVAEASARSFLRRKTAQGKAQFEQRPEDKKK